jgi:deferrochelatase/peroxidase EfeB
MPRSPARARDARQKRAGRNVRKELWCRKPIRKQQIARFNMPFGSVTTGEFGTYFIGYARNPELIEHMLRNMFISRRSGRETLDK